MNLSNRRKVVEHLMNHSAEGLTKAQALFLYGIQNLPDVIMHLRRNGWQIERRTKKFHTFRECVYYMDFKFIVYADYNGDASFNHKTKRYEALCE